MENLETDISYLLGSYIGLARKIELELDRMSHQETESKIEEHLDEFLESPAKALRVCQDIILKEQEILMRINKTELIEQCSDVLEKLNIEALEYVEIDFPNFMHGYHTKKELDLD